MVKLINLRLNPIVDLALTKILVVRPKQKKTFNQQLIN